MKKIFLLFSLIFLIIFNLSYSQAFSSSKKISDINQLKLRLEKPTANDIHFIQEISRDLGLLDKATENIDQSTIKAIKEIKKKNSLSQTGKIDSKTFVKKNIQKQENNSAKFKSVKSEQTNGGYEYKYKFLLNLEDVDFNYLNDYWYNYETYLESSLYCDNQLKNTEFFKFKFGSLRNQIFELSIQTDCKNPSVSFKVPHFLSKIKTPLILNSYPYDYILLTNGDANNDNSIDDLDASSILVNYKGILEENGKRYDLNLDGEVNEKDLEIILKNFGKNGDIK